MCATYTDGFRATAVCPIGGPFASLKARKTGEALLKRYVNDNISFISQSLIEPAL